MARWITALSKSKKRHSGWIVFLSGLFVAPLFLLVLAYTQGRSDTTYIDSLCAEQDCLCGDWDTRSTGEYVIENNVWNKGNINKYEQCVYIEQGHKGVDAGWAWNWPGLRFDVVAYPDIIYGKKPWFPSSTTPLLPNRIAELDCLQADFEVVQLGSGKGNLSFDLWVTENRSATPESITREIMIWLSHSGFRPAGSRVDSLNLDGYDIEVWQRENHSVTNGLEWTFFAFVYQSDLTEGPIDLMDYLDFLVDSGYISADEFLAGVDLGNEIVSGFGQTLLRNYEIGPCDQPVADSD